MSGPFVSVEVVPHRKWINHRDGREASPYGAAPWQSPAEKPDWELVTRGYTWRCTDHRGQTTVGASRRPAETLEEAEEVAAKLRGD